MDEPTLKYKRETLLDSLNAQLQEREQKREEARQKAAERNQKFVDQLVALFEEFPQFLVWAADRIGNDWGHSDARVGSDAFRESVQNAYGAAPRVDGLGDYDPDEHLKRLIRIYEKAEDEVVSVSVRDEVYSYL